jgi:hypothetical protein
MKKMIVIAALIGGMLMPAQMMASNDRGNAKPRVENRSDKRSRNDKFDKKGPDVKKNDGKKGYGDNRDFGGKNDFKNSYRPGKPDKVVVINKPIPPVSRPCPPIQPRRKCDSDIADVIGAVGAVVGIAALVSLIAQ